MRVQVLRHTPIPKYSQFDDNYSQFDYILEPLFWEMGLLGLGRLQFRSRFLMRRPTAGRFIFSPFQVMFSKIRCLGW
jgi:hypothetical protein